MKIASCKDFDHLKRSTETTGNSAINGGDFEGKEAHQDLESDVVCGVNSGLAFQSETCLDESTKAMPVVGSSPSEEESKILDSLSAGEPEGGVDSNDARSDEIEGSGAIHPDISNEDIRTAHIINANEDAELVIIPEDVKPGSGKMCDDVSLSSLSERDPLSMNESDKEQSTSYDINAKESATAKEEIREDTPSFECEMGSVDLSSNGNLDENISVTELRLNSSLYIYDKPPAIETILENVIISSSFREDGNNEVSKYGKKAKKDLLSEKRKGSEPDTCNLQVEEQNSVRKDQEADEQKLIDTTEDQHEDADGVRDQLSDDLEEQEATEFAGVESVSRDAKNSQHVDETATYECRLGGAMAMEEEQHEVRISDSYALIDIASTLLNYDKELPYEKVRSAVNESEIHNVENLIAEISNCIEEGEFSKAVEFLRRYRGYPDTSDTVLDDNEKDILMALFAKHLMKNKTSVFALTNSLENLAEVCDQLSECMTELLALICSENDKRDA